MFENIPPESKQGNRINADQNPTKPLRKKNSSEPLKNNKQRKSNLKKRNILTKQQLRDKLQMIQENTIHGQQISKIGSWTHDLKTGETYFTEEIYRILGCSPEQFGGELVGFYSFAHPDDLNLIMEATQDVFRGKEYEIEYRICTSDGFIKYIHEKTKTLYDENHSPARVIGIMQDITKQKTLMLTQTLTHIGNWDMDLAANVIHCSSEIFNIHGIQPKEYRISYGGFLKLIHPDDVQMIEDMLKNPQVGKISLEFRMSRPDGSMSDIFAVVEFLFDEDGNPTHIYGTAQDITEKKELEKQINRKQQEIDGMSKRFHALIREATDVFEILAPDGTITYISEACEQVIGYKPEERIGRKVYEFYKGTELRKVKSMMKRILDYPEQRLRDTVLIEAKDGSQRYLEVIQQNLMSEPSIQGIVVNFRDITQRVQMERKMLYLSTHDEVTGLPNRLFFNRELNSHMQCLKDGGSRLAVIMIDVDGFKHISDVLGYQLGDELIIRISERLRSIFGDGALVCRYSASRLAVLLPHFYDSSELNGRIQKVMELSANTFKINSYGLDVGMHIGISICQGSDQQPDTIVQQAEMALFLAKNEGKNQYRYYSTGIDIKNYKQFELRNDLRLSIEKNQLQIHFQPIINLQTNEIIAAEALIRWEHPHWGMVPPDEFISLAEETGFIINIGGWVLREVCRKYTEWLDKGLPPIKVSINFSSIQFFEANFVENILHTIFTFGLDPSFLIMEITESTLLDSKEKAELDIKRLKASGIQTALDDFGTGFSSLAYLHSFDIDIIKIDGSFIRNSIVDAASDIIIRSIIQMALELKLNLVAEGIENYQQLIYLQKLNCFAGQGYLFSKPLPVDVFESVLSQKVCNPTVQSEIAPRSNKERRKSVRMSLPGLLEADLSILELNKTKVDIGNTKVLVKNISLDGLCFITNVRMPVGKDTILQFAAQFAGMLIKVSGSAVWIKSLGSGLYEYGVKFDLKKNEKQELLSILNQVQEGMKQEALVAEDTPASGLNEYYKRRISEVIYEGKK